MLSEEQRKLMITLSDNGGLKALETAAAYVSKQT
jgi:hypothetical protein